MRRFLLATAFILTSVSALAQTPPLGPSLSPNALRRGGPSLGNSYGIPTHDSMGNLSADETVLPDGSTTAVRLGSITSGAVNAFPRTGSTQISSGNYANTITGTLYTQNNNLYGNDISQTAAVVAAYRAFGCVMGGAQNGVSAGGEGHYGSVDTVAFCDGIGNPTGIYTGGGTYDATHFYPTVPLTPTQVSSLRFGVKGQQAGTWIVVPSADGTQNYVTWVTGASADGSVINTFPDGWWILGTTTYATPPDGLVASIGVVTKLWARNTILDLSANGYATHGIGDELDVENSKANADLVGYTAVQLGTHEIAGPSYQSRGIWGTGYQSQGARQAGFMFDPTLQSIIINPAIAAFASRQTAGNAFEVQPNGAGSVPTFAVDSQTGSITARGNLTTAGTVINYAFPSPVDGLSVLSGGSYNQGIPVITIDPPPAGGTQATATPSAFGMSTPHLALGGTGYTAETCTVQGGTFSNAATFTSTVTGGVITGVTGLSPGIYSVFPTGNLAFTCPSGGSGGAITANFSMIAASMTNIGAGYATFPNATVSAQPGETAATLSAQMNIGFQINPTTGAISVNNGEGGLTGHSVGIGSLTDPAFINLNGGPKGATGANVRLVNQSDGVLDIYGRRTSDNSNPEVVRIRGADVNALDIKGGATGTPVTLDSFGEANSSLVVQGSGTGAGMTHAMTAAPTTTTLPASVCADVIVSGAVSRQCNNGGALVQSTLLNAIGAPQVRSYTVAALPVCNTTTDGAWAEVTDQTASPVYGVAPTGGGTLHWPVFCNGTGWTLH